MALGGWEWIVIILAVVVILVWGPTKIPELARGLGRARGEFERASKEYAGKPLETEVASSSRTSGDEMMLVIAKGLGINTEGKSKEQIFQEIILNIKAIKSS